MAAGSSGPRYALRMPASALPEAAREADHAAAELWSIRMDAYGGPPQPSPTIGQCINAGYR